MQNIFTVAKLAALGLIVILGLMIFKASNLQPLVGSAGWSPLAVAAVPTLLAYAGYNTVAYLSEEFKEPRKNLPRGIVIGVVVVIAVYLIVNFVAVGAVPISKLAKSSAALTLIGETAIGAVGGTAVAIGALIAIFGGLNGDIMGFARVPFAMARDDNFFGSFSKVHSKYQTPYVTLIFMAVLSSLYVLTGSFLSVLVFGVFMSRSGEVMVTASLIWLRRKMPKTERPIKMWGYPVTALLALGLTTWLVVSIAPSEILDGIYLILSAIPAYIFFVYWSRYQSSKKQRVVVGAAGAQTIQQPQIQTSVDSSALQDAESSVNGRFEKVGDA